MCVECIARKCVMEALRTACLVVERSKRVCMYCAACRFVKMLAIGSR